MIDNYIIQVTQEGSKYLAQVSEQTSMDQREGPGYTLLGIALDSNKEDAIYNAIQDAFFS
jgi:hypothetical protein